MSTYGKYTYSNYTLLNPLIDDDEFESTSYHEYMHMILSVQTVFGMCLYCMEKLKIIAWKKGREDEKIYNTFTGFLNNRTNKIQEGLAVFTQYVFKLTGSEKEEAERFVNTLQCDNRQYYKYLEPLLFIVQIIKEERDRNKILAVSNMIFILAKHCMDADIYEVPPETFRDQRSLQQWISKPDTGKKYIPDTMFINYLKDCRRRNFKSCEEICEYFAFLESDKQEIYDFESRLEEVKKYIETLFWKSKYINAYRNKLSEINVKEVALKDSYLQQLPSLFNDEEINKLSRLVTKEEIHKASEQPYTTLFLLGDLDSNFKMAFKKAGITNELPYDKEYCSINEIVLLFGLEDKKILMSIMESKEVDKLLSNNKCKSVVLVSYKQYDYVRDVVNGHENIEQDIFIYCDRTYGNSIVILKSWRDRTVFYRYLKYDNMLVLIIKICAGRYFILPMTSLVAYEADLDIRENEKHMKMASEEDDEGFDEHIITDQDMLDKFDTIINCLFFMSLRV